MTIGINFVWSVVDIDGLKIKLQIWDTAGQEKYKTITQNYYRNSHGAIISFSIDSRESFYSVRIFHVILRSLDRRTNPNCKGKHTNNASRYKV